MLCKIENLIGNNNDFCNDYNNTNDNNKNTSNKDCMQ